MKIKSAQQLLPAILLQCFLFSAFAQSFLVSEKVMGWPSGDWSKGTIAQIGSGNYKVDSYVQWAKHTVGQWVRAKNIPSVKTAAATDEGGPRNGEYIILSYGNVNNPLRLGYFTLNNGKYVYSNLAKKQIGKGTYTYNPNKKAVQWTSGPFKDAAWGGQFEIAREGKTHKIRVNRVTIGSNSIDSK